MDVSRLQANVAELEKKGGRIVFDNCIDGEKKRLCFEMAKDQENVWKGKDGGRFVIPAGY